MFRTIGWQHSFSSLLLLAALLLVIAPAQAHTGLRTSTPADGAVINAAPEQIHLVFTAAVSLVRVNVTDSEGRQVDIGFKPDPATKSEFPLGVPALPAGKYQVEWAVIGADGHTVTDTFGFTIDPAAAPSHGGQHAAESHGH